MCWAPFVLLGIERVRIVPGFTASNPFDLYYMPYTHSLPGALLWSCVGGLAYEIVARPSRRRTGVIIGLAVLSHWVLDFIVHRPDLPLYDNSAKVGLGLWNAPALAFGLEATLLLGGMWLCFRQQPARVLGTLVFCVLCAESRPMPSLDRRPLLIGHLRGLRSFRTPYSPW